MQNKILEINLHNKLAPHLELTEEIVWASQTDIDRHHNLISLLKQEARQEFRLILGTLILALFLLFLLPKYSNTIIFLFVVGITVFMADFAFTYWDLQKAKNFDIGAYALTQSHFYELDKALQFKQKYKAHKARHAISGDEGLIISPLGPGLTSRYQLLNLPKDINLQELQAALDHARKIRP